MIQHDGYRRVAIWDCAHEDLHTFPVSPKIPIRPPLRTEDNNAPDIPEFPIPNTHLDPFLPLTHVIAVPNTWNPSETEDDLGATLHILLDDRLYDDSAHKRSVTPIRGYWYKVIPSLNGKLYQDTPPEFELQAHFHIPPNPQGVCSFETHLPFLGGVGNGSHFTGSALAINAVSETEPFRGLLLYTIPDGLVGDLVNEVQSDVPKLRVAWVHGDPKPYSRQICMASGRLFHAAGVPGRPFEWNRSRTYVSDFLHPCDMNEVL